MDLLSAAGSIASLFGLGLTYLAWRKASSAAEAANDARKAVQTWGLVEELERAALVAEQLLVLLREGRFAESRLRSDDLVRLLSEVPNRRHALVDAASNSELQQSRIQAQSMAGRLNMRDGLQLPADEQERLVGVTQRYITTKLREVVGRTKSKTDERVKA